MLSCCVNEFFNCHPSLRAWDIGIDMNLALNHHVELAVNFVNVNRQRALVLGALGVQAGSDILEEHGWFFPAILIAKLFSLNINHFIRILNHRLVTI